MIAAQRAYRDAKRWVKAARPARIGVWLFARRAFWGSFVAGLIVMSLFGLLTPGNFGLPQRDVFQTGWPLWVLLAVMALGAVTAIREHRRLRWLFDRIREPFLRPLSDNDYFEGAVGALEACPGTFRARFAIGWIWVPAAVAILGGTFAFAVSYFVVDAVLSRFDVGLIKPVLMVINAILSLIAFGSIARRLSTWRFAASVHKYVTTGY